VTRTWYVLANVCRGWRRVDFVAVDVRLGDTNHAAVAESDADEHALDFRFVLVPAAHRLLHLDRGLQRFLRARAKITKRLSPSTFSSFLVPLDDRHEQPLGFLNDAQVVHHPELRDAAREPGEIGGYDAPRLSVRFPDGIVIARIEKLGETRIERHVPHCKAWLGSDPNHT
jgi:hypothetical protein